MKLPAVGHARQTLLSATARMMCQGSTMAARFVVSSMAMEHFSSRLSAPSHTARSMRWSLLVLVLPLFYAGCYGNVFGSEFESCEEVNAALEEELSSLQACSVDSDCGQILEGTSCGCTNDLVARKELDTARFRSLQGRGEELECPAKLTDCSCPEADGFICTNGVCGWKYVP
jgi:hypothetical protein